MNAATEEASPVIGTVAIIGLGLIGGSMARDITATGVRVIGYDRDPDSVVSALEEAVIMAPHPSGASSAGFPGIGDADAIVIATPVDETAAVLSALANQQKSGNLRARLITDVGSTKRSTVDLAASLGLKDRFVGSHPIAGDHNWGWRASRRGMFRGARVYLCSTPDANSSASELVHLIWRSLGAFPEWIDAVLHDEALAWASHLPQVTATALAIALDEHGVDRSLLGPGGRDVTRLAGSSPELWTSIVTDNAASISSALERLEGQLHAMRMELAGGEKDKLRARFTHARNWFTAGRPATDL